MRSIRVEDLLSKRFEKLDLHPIAGPGGMGRTIVSSKVQRPGKGLVTAPSSIRVNRPLIFGIKEIDLMNALPPGRRASLFRELALLNTPCIIVEGTSTVTEEMLAFARYKSIALLRSTLTGPSLAKTVQGCLHELLAEGFHIQGVLMRVYGMGVLILGKSSIGKSECALDLITRGHALVADDLVEINLQGRKKVIGAAPELLRHIIEVRGLGIMNIMELYGAEAVAESTEIDLVAEFLDMEQFKEMDRTGLIRWTYTLADADIPLYRIPVSQNRNIAIIMEVAVRNHLLLKKGISPVEVLEKRIASRLEVGGAL